MKKLCLVLLTAFLLAIPADAVLARGGGGRGGRGGGFGRGPGGMGGRTGRVGRTGRNRGSSQKDLKELRKRTELENRDACLRDAAIDDV